MAQFDPYRIWLGIPPEDQPPNHYRLLGIGLFESNPDAISNAADRQMVHLRSFRSGPRAAICEQILSEVSAARVCLLDARQRAAYDAQLRAAIDARTPATATPGAVPPPLAAVAPPSPAPAPNGDMAPPLVPPAAPPPVQTGIGAISSSPGRVAYASRRKRSSMQGVLITLGLIFATLILVAVAMSLSNSQRPNGRHRGTVKDAPGRNGASRSSSPRRRGGNGSAKHRGRRKDEDTGNGPIRIPGLWDDPSGDPEDPTTFDRPSTTVDPDTARPIDAIEDPALEATVGPTSSVSQPVGEGPSAAPEPAGPAPVPDDAQWHEAETRLREKDFMADLHSARSTSERAAFVRKLLTEGVESQQDSASSYAVLQIARAEAAQLGDAALALDAVDQLAERYQVDVLSEKVKTLATVSESTKATAQKKMLVKEAVELMQQAAEAEDSESAGQLASLARTHVEGIRDRMLSRRVAEGAKAALLEAFGGSEETEAAVDRALQWIAKHQSADGSWSFDHTSARPKESSPNPGDLDKARNAATALTLLPLFGASAEPRQGKYRKNLASGIKYLKKRAVALGPGLATLAEMDAGSMPSHALGMLALCEECAVSGDSSTKRLVDGAVGYLAATQNDDGGWPAKPELPDTGWSMQPQFPDPGRAGGAKDRGGGRAAKPNKQANQPIPSSSHTTAWNLIALEAARRADVQVPDTVLIDAGGFLAHAGGTDKSAAAVAAFARANLQLPADEKEIADYASQLGQAGPSTAGDLYTNYFHTRLMRDFGDSSAWKAWNVKLRGHLLTTQVKDGQAAGSWFPAAGRRMNREGGRLFCTALAALILETYYRRPEGSKR